MRKHLLRRLMRTGTLCLFTGFLFFAPKVKSQVATYYTWAQSNNTYTPGFPSGVATPANIFPLAWDDLSYTGYKLPFNFNYNGTVYTAANGYIGLDTDGWFCFSNGVPTMTGQLGGGSWVTASDHTGVYLNGSANNNGFAGFNADLHYQSLTPFSANLTNGNAVISNVTNFTDVQIGVQLNGTGIPAGTIVIAFNAGAKTITMSTNATSTLTSTTVTPYSSIYAFTRGTAPNRQFVVQWTQVRRYNYPELYNDRFNFQMILNEAGGVANLQTLQVMYGNIVTPETATLDFQIGLRGASSADFNARKSLTGWATTTAATANTDLVRLTNTIRPASGLTFTWSPCTVAPGAAGAITGPTSVCPGTDQVFSIPSVPGAVSYTWTYTGTNTTYSASTVNPTNTFTFAPTATGGTITVTPTNICGNGTSSSKVLTLTVITPANISYSKATFCTADGAQSITRTGPAGGTYSVTPAGLTLNASTGAITPSTSSEGTYTVKYAYTSNTCVLEATTSVSIKSGPVVTASATPSNVCTSPANSQLLSEGSSDYTVSSIAFSMLTPTGTPVVLANTYSDDGISGTVNLPFSFNFYGQNITQVYACVNGFMFMGGTGGTTYSAQTLPNSAAPNNIIALAWRDLVLDPSTNPGANIRYFINGTTPNRIFVMEFNNLRFLASNGEVTGQIRLYETGSVIEIAAQKVDDAGGLLQKTMGIENSTGTQALTPPGRNNEVWNVNNEAWRFSRGGPFTYAWTPVTYLNNSSISNPTATGIVSSITYTVRVTDQVSGCHTDKQVPIGVGAPLNGTYTVGSGGNYPTLTAAIDAYNTMCIGGPIIFELIDNNYTTSETFPIKIKSNGYASSVNTLTIRPAAGKTVNIAGNNATAIILFEGADYVTINGSNNPAANTRNLTIYNSNSSASTATVVYMQAPSAGDGATNNAVKNTVIQGTGATTTWCALFSGGTDPLELPLIGNSNNTYFNNKIIKAATAIALVGPSGNELRNVVDSNEVGSAVAAEKLGISGIEIYQQANARITRNKIQGISWASYTSDAYGIFVVGTGSNCVISANMINDIAHTSIYGAHGIYLANSVTGVNLLVSNNMISNVVASGYNSFGESDNGFGITVSSGGGYNIYFNTVSLTTNPSETGAHRAACFYVGSSVTASNAIDFRNNILANFQTVGNANSRYAMMVRAANSVFSNINYNVYYTTSNKLLCRGSNANTYTTLATVQTNIGGNANSMVETPVFMSATNLHLNTTSNVNISDKGQPISGVVTDFDDQTRSGLTPDPGADEFVPPNFGSWVGRVSVEWTDPRNWEANFVPTNSTDVYIKGGFTFMPTVRTVQPMRNLNVSAPATPPTLTITNTGTIQVYGTLTRSGGTVYGMLGGTMEMMSTAAQTIPANLFLGNMLSNLIVSNANTVTGVTLGGPLEILRSLTFSANGKKLTTNNNLTFKSTITETAWLGNVTGKTIVGNATVERYIGTGTTGPAHSKSWQLLGVPISGAQTVKQAWQENGAAPNSNPRPGFGTQLTSDLTNATSLGFDVYTQPGPSIKTYDPITNGWVGLPNTNATPIYNQKGYMVFVRGDRSVTTYNATANPTIMRTNGKLFTTGADAPPVSTVQAGRMESIGNPYASAIDFRQLSRNNVSDIYYLWDPRLTTQGPTSAYGLGGFQTFTKDGAGDYRVTPGGGSFGAGGSVNNIIQSGAAFFVQSSQPLAGTNGTVAFSEAAKVGGSLLVNREPLGVNNDLRINLHVMQNDVPVLIDGVLVQFGEGYNNDVDGNDARKMSNVGENLSIHKDSFLLSVERRGMVTATDTLFLKLGNVRYQNYQFELKAGDWLPGLQAWLVDTYNDSRTPLNANNNMVFNFSISNNPDAYNANRFYIVFRAERPLPVRHIRLTGEPYQENTNRLNWSVTGEQDMAAYQLERSLDGENFEQIAVQQAQNTPTGQAGYQYVDTRSLKTYNYYRVKALSIDGQIQYSNVVLLRGKTKPEKFVLYPNPAEAATALRYENLSPGVYRVQVNNVLGQTIKIEKMFMDGSGEVKLNYILPKGSYGVSVYDESDKLHWTGRWIVIR